MYSDQANHYCIHPQADVTELQNHHSPNPVNCGECECLIAGKMLNCAACNSHLHPFCQTMRETINSELHPGHHLTRLNHDCFQLLTRRHCAVCSEEIKGVSYTCSPCNFDVHPQCSQLPCRIPHGKEAHHQLVLQLTETLPITNCHVCGKGCGQWAYRCDVCSDNVHFWCLVGIHEGGPTTTTTSRGLESHFDTPRQHQGQVNYGLPLPMYLPPHYYNYYNAGVYQHHGHPWGLNQFHNYNHAGVHHHYGHQWDLTQFHNYNHAGVHHHHGHQWGLTQFHNYNPAGGGNHFNHGGGYGGGDGGGGSGSGGGGGGGVSGSSNNSGSGGGGGGGGGFMSKIGKSFAVGLICDLVIKLITGGLGGN